MIYDIATYLPHRGQLEFHKSIANEVLVVSSIRAGKSFGVINDVIMNAWNDKSGFGTLVTAPTYKLVEVILEREITNKLLHMNLLKQHSYSRHETLLRNGNIIYYRSLEDPDISLRGLNISRAYVDEAAYASSYSIDVLRGRLLTTNGQLKIITTPAGLNNWVYEDYFAGERKSRVEYIKFELRDNPIITEEAIERLLESYDPLLARQEIYGEFVSLYDKQVYYAFDEVGNVGTYPADPASQVYIGLDFNIDKNPWVAIQKLQNNTFKVIAEGYGARATADVARQILDLPYSKLPYPTPIIIPDATGANRVQGVAHTQFELLRQAGIHNLIESRSNPKREVRFANTNAAFCNALNQRRLLIDKSCVRLLKELRELSYKEYTEKVDDRGGEVGHITDALSYAIYYLTARSVGKETNTSSTFIDDWKSKKRAYDAFTN